MPRYSKFHPIPFSFFDTAVCIGNEYTHANIRIIKIIVICKILILSVIIKLLP